MQGKATLFGHPIHPILVSFPIGFFVGALISDIISAFSHTPVWPALSVVLIGFGVIGALLAAIFGFTDYLTAPMSDEAKRTATTHMILNLIVVALFIIAFFVRYDRPQTALGYVLTVAGVIVLGIAGFLGGHLSYHYGVGVADEKAPPERRLPSGTATARR
jgi:uncharacterized membrane protein